MDNIRLPEDFTDRVMQKIEQREQELVRRKRTLAAIGWSIGTVSIITAAVVTLHYSGIRLNLPAWNILLAGINSWLEKAIWGTVNNVLTLLSGINPSLTGITIAVFILACAGLYHDYRHSRRHRKSLIDFK